MNVRALVLLAFIGLALPLVVAAPSHAGPRSHGLRAALGGGVVVPPEWAGIWTYVDSTYDCDGNFESLDGGTDTLCAGRVFQPVEDNPYPLVCNENTTASTVEVSCTAFVEIVPDCDAMFTFEFNGTRTGDSYFVTALSRTEFVGTAPECGFLPNSCSRTNTHGTRIAPEPVAYCATPVEPTTWGRVKTRYR